MKDGGLLLLPNLILAGDLNLTFGVADIWGMKSRIDPLAQYFSHHFSDHGLVDLAPPCAGPTWKNDRGGIEGINKRLDWFLVSSSLIPGLLLHRVWTVLFEISDHYLLCLD